VIRRRQQIICPTDAADTAPQLYRTIRRSSNALTISPAGWRILPLSGIISTSGIAALAHAIVAPTLPPDKTLPTTSDLVPPTLQRSSTMLHPALHLQHAKQTSTADVSGGARLHYSHRPPFHHRQVKQTPVPKRHGFAPLRVPSQAHPSVQVAHSLRPLRG
jgi:hypothetical protein